MVSQNLAITFVITQVNVLQNWNQPRILPMDGSTFFMFAASSANRPNLATRHPSCVFESNTHVGHTHWKNVQKAHLQCCCSIEGSEPRRNDYKEGFLSGDQKHKCRPRSGKWMKHQRESHIALPPPPQFGVTRIRCQTYVPHLCWPMAP